MKVKESLNVTFDESPPPTKLSPLVDDDVGEEEAIRKNTKIVNINNEEDESIEVDEIINIKESKNHPLDQCSWEIPVKSPSFALGVWSSNQANGRRNIFQSINGTSRRMLKSSGRKDSKYQPRRDGNGDQAHYGGWKQTLWIALKYKETDIQEKEQKESQKQTNPSTEWKGQSQKSSQVKKIQLEGLKLPNLKLYYKRLKRQGSKLQTG
ncbi:hypothetical protein Tco_0508073 [Tanacetum coccineum]